MDASVKTWNGLFKSRCTNGCTDCTMVFNLWNAANWSSFQVILSDFFIDVNGASIDAWCCNCVNHKNRFNSVLVLGVSTSIIFLTYDYLHYVLVSSQLILNILIHIDHVNI